MRINPELNSDTVITKKKTDIIHTSVSLRKKHKDLLLETAKSLNISTNKLMIILIKYGYNRHLNHAEDSQSVVYQPSTKDFKIINLYLSQNDYEKNLDARRFCKFGISWMLAYALIHYLKAVVWQIMNKGIQSVFEKHSFFESYQIQKTTNSIEFTAIWHPLIQ